MLPITDFPLASRGTQAVLDTEKVLTAVDVVLAFIRAKFGTSLDSDAHTLLAVAFKTQSPTDIYVKHPALFPAPVHLHISVRWAEKEGENIVELQGESGLLKQETQELNNRLYKACGWAHRHLE